MKPNDMSKTLETRPSTLETPPGPALQPVILCGGSGSRLWPLSREHYPKQLLPLLGPNSLLVDTLTRMRHEPTSAQPILPALVVTNEAYRFLTAEQCRVSGVPVERLLLEPLGRNTAPALTVAALFARNTGADPVLLVMPADHVIRDVPCFQETVARASVLAAEGALVTFGITPTGPETGYGYLKMGTPLEGQERLPFPACTLERFIEKPDRARALALLEEGRTLWNSGIFVLRASVWLEMLERFCAPMLAACEQAVVEGIPDQDFFRLAQAPFEACLSDSIDYAVMEPLTADARSAGRALVIPFAGGWSDVGAWDALWELGDKDAAGNRLLGDVITHQARNNLVHATHRLVACVGIEDLVVVETPDAVLVARRDAAQDVKKVVGQLKAAQRSELLAHRKEYRPWGWYDAIDTGDRFQVKRIVVRPGASLSLQMHHHRAEHWVVVRGTARVTRGEECYLVAENQSTYIPVGTRHRLENPGKIDLEMIEVQSGAYLGEDDIIRFEDAYRRT